MHRGLAHVLLKLAPTRDTTASLSMARQPPVCVLYPGPACPAALAFNAWLLSRSSSAGLTQAGASVRTAALSWPNGVPRCGVPRGCAALRRPVVAMSLSLTHVNVTKLCSWTHSVGLCIGPRDKEPVNTRTRVEVASGLVGRDAVRGGGHTDESPQGLTLHPSGRACGPHTLI